MAPMSLPINQGSASVSHPLVLYSGLQLSGHSGALPFSLPVLLKMTTLVSVSVSSPFSRSLSSPSPPCAVQEQLVPLVRDSQCLILVGETGSGKTTRECRGAL